MLTPEAVVFRFLDIAAYSPAGCAFGLIPSAADAGFAFEGVLLDDELFFGDLWDGIDLTVFEVRGSEVDLGSDNVAAPESCAHFTALSRSMALVVPLMMPS